MNPPLTPALQQQLRELLLAGRKIDAIKLLRDATGLDLAAAKAQVEALEPASPGAAASRPVGEESIGQLQQLLFAGHKIEAIKLLRNRTGLQLKDAKEKVEAYEAELRAKSPGSFTAPPQRLGRGCLLAAGFAAAVLAVIMALLVRYLSSRS